MKKKVFKACNIQEAIARIKTELGPDAMILSTRKIRPGSRNPYEKPMFEIEAAAASDQPEPAFDDRMMVSIQEELAGIRDMISISGLSSGMHHMICNHFESTGILASLLRAGVSEKRAHTFIQKACYDMEKDLKKGPAAGPLRKYVMQQCVRNVDTKDAFMAQDNQGKPYAAAFVGPTGVGKTTTIAKLAAMLSFKRKMKVGLISIDNYRIGAFEQLKAYASIMGLMCLNAYCEKDLGAALDKMAYCDVVLIDTAGHSHYDTAKMEEGVKMLKAGHKICVHLVLSVTSEFINMKEAASAFSVLKPDTYVFTKVDETRRCGKMLDQISDFNLPVSLITNGQRVPEDLVVPDRQTLVKMMLGKGQKGNA